MDPAQRGGPWTWGPGLSSSVYLFSFEIPRQSTAQLVSGIHRAETFAHGTFFLGKIRVKLHISG